MKTIDITTILGSELKSRTSARDFAKYLQNMQISKAQVDFSHVKSVTRSFMDEFYYLILREDNAQGVQLELTNMGQQAQEFLQAVKVTADAPRKTMVSDGARFFNPATIQQLSDYLATL
ncbi:MAG: hypothetical protein IJS70_01135 [Bacteroidales bacterium]|nr:hypothetical protein [Bacteroidales bacterium]